MGTVIVGLILLTVIILIISKMIKDKKKGKSSCGCNCGYCPNSALCHQEKQSKQ